MAVSQQSFGTTRDGHTVTAFRLENGNGARAVILDYGGTVQSLSVPNAKGGFTDVVLGYDTLAEYEKNDGYVGALIGRMGNRVGGSAFSLNGKTYSLFANDGPNHLHGGRRGFDKRVWNARVCTNGSLELSLYSPDGEEGYPGGLRVAVVYMLTESNALAIDYSARAEADTIVNLTNHCYFNLNGGGSALSHELRLSADHITENGPGCLPNGTLADVTGTPFDFREFKMLGRDIDADDAQLKLVGGYDCNFVLSGFPAAILRSPASGIEMTVTTDRPGVQLYTANFLSDRHGKSGAPIRPRDAVCLETQLFPNAMACPGFPSPVLQGGKTLRSRTVYQFGLI